MNKYSITMIIWKIKYRINDIIWRFECAIGKYLPIDFNGMFLNCDDCKYHKSIINHKITDSCRKAPCFSYGDIRQ